MQFDSHYELPLTHRNGRCSEVVKVDRVVIDNHMPLQSHSVAFKVCITPADVPEHSLELSGTLAAQTKRQSKYWSNPKFSSV